MSCRSRRSAYAGTVHERADRASRGQCAGDAAAWRVCSSDRRVWCRMGCITVVSAHAELSGMFCLGCEGEGYESVL